jgi:DNA (cytosine-5)-methyltransferase 1
MMMAWELLGKTSADYEMIAVNHWQVAIDTHTANHPAAAHHCKSLAEIGDPCKLITSRTDRRVKLLWASPECTGHSRARGGKPSNDQSRSSANLILDFLDKLNVETLMIENVREFVDWGPLGVDNTPLKSKKGTLFNHWLAGLKVRGYKYEWRILNCADYGTPTTRQRFFLIAVKGNRTIRWPEPTHIGPAERAKQPLFADSRKPWVAAREVIDWADLGKDIFTQRKKPLVPNTMERIRAGARKFWGIEMDVTAMVQRGLVPLFVDLAEVSAAELAAWRPPVSDVEFRLLENYVGLPTLPYLADLHGKSTVHGVGEPVQTITAGAGHAAVVSPLVLPHRVFDRFDVDSPELPLRTITGTQQISVASPFLSPAFGERGDQAWRTHSIDDPAPTATSRGCGNLVTPALIAIDNASGAGVRSADLPLSTLVTKANVGLAQPLLVTCNHGVRAGESFEHRVSSVDRTMQTVTGSKGEALVSPFLAEYYGTSTASGVSEPVPTLTTRERFALVTMRLDEVDAPVGSYSWLPAGARVSRMMIFFRMLRLAECARAQSFPDDYKWTGTAKEQQVQVGNAVPPQMAMHLALPTLAQGGATRTAGVAA